MTKKTRAIVISILGTIAIAASYFFGIDIFDIVEEAGVIVEETEQAIGTGNEIEKGINLVDSQIDAILYGTGE